jgi:hypothetical protein
VNARAGIASGVMPHSYADDCGVQAHQYRILRAIDLSLVENGAKMVFLLRLSPFVPCKCSALPIPLLPLRPHAT